MHSKSFDGQIGSQKKRELFQYDFHTPKFHFIGWPAIRILHIIDKESFFKGTNNPMTMFL